MTVEITLFYKLEMVYLLHIVWHDDRDAFIVGEFDLLVGKLEG